MRTDVREVLVEHGTTAAHDHPAEVDRGLRKGTRLFWRRLLLVNIAAAVVAVVLFLVLGAGSGHIELPTAPGLMRITVTPSEVHLSPGETQSLVASGGYDDGTQRDLTTTATWRSDRPTVAKVVQGTVTALRPGRATIITEGESGTTGSVVVIVGPSGDRLTAIAVTPGSRVAAPRHRIRFTAWGVFNDGESRDISSRVHWSTGNDHVAKIGAGGLATTFAPGTTYVTAFWRGKVDRATLEVRKKPGGSPSPTPSTTTTAVLTDITIESPVLKIAVDESLQLDAMGNYDDGSTRDLTDVAWSAAHESGVATVDSSGLVRGTSPGSITIFANSEGVMGKVEVTVVVLESITVDPPKWDVCPPHDTVALTAEANYDDETNQDVTARVVWGSDHKEVATVDSNGVVTGTGVGRALITATLFGVTSSATVACDAQSTATLTSAAD
jgi:hypothetical protein